MKLTRKKLFSGQRDDQGGWGPPNHRLRRLRDSGDEAGKEEYLHWYSTVYARGDVHAAEGARAELQHGGRRSTSTISHTKPDTLTIIGGCMGVRLYAHRNGDRKASKRGGQGQRFEAHP